MLPSIDYEQTLKPNTEASEPGTFGPEAVHYLADRAGVRWVHAEGHADNFYPWVQVSSGRGRAVDVEAFDGRGLGEWQDRTRRSSFSGGGVNMNEVRNWGCRLR